MLLGPLSGLADDLRLPLQNLALPVSAETWNRSLNVAVSAVADGSPVAQTKGVEPGDIVTQVNGQLLHFLFAAATH